MNVDIHLHGDSELKLGARPSDGPTRTGTWVSVILDGNDLTTFGTVDQLIEVGRMFLSAALDLRDAPAKSLLEVATAPYLVDEEVGQ